MLALLAFAGLPALAQARGCDSGEIEYGGCETIPKVGGEKDPNSGGGADSRTTPAKPSQPGEEAGSPGSTENEDQGKHAGGAGGNGGDRGNGDGNGPGGHRIGISDADPAVLSPDSGDKTHDLAQSSGGSSPLVPILVAVAVLAALSFGAVVYRQRHQLPAG